MNTANEKYRLGLDLGTNSIGWAAVSLDENGAPCGLLDMGVRIFPDGRKDSRSGDGPSNAVTRRKARGERRRRAHYKKRRSKLLKALVRHGLMPTDEQERKALARRDPYELRARALLNEPLTPYELGRALFDLNQGRGFKSNRKVDGRDKDSGPVKEAAKRLNKQLNAENARTLGEFLYQRRENNPDAPFRFRNQNQGTNLKAKYELYPTRQMISDEFDSIWQAQAPHHKALMTDAAKQSLHEIIFYQQDPESPPVGKCTLDPASDKEDIEGFRCSWAHPLAQRFRIWEEVRNLEFQEAGGKWRPLSKEQGDSVAEDLLQRKTVTFDRIRKLLKLPPDSYFNLESERRKDLKGDETAAKLEHQDFFGKAWRILEHGRQIEIVELLLSDHKEDDEVAEWLTRHTELDRDAAKRVVSAPLPEGHCRLGLRAIRNMLPHMKRGMQYHAAANEAGYDHARAPSGELSPTGRLPYYGKWLSDHLTGTGDHRDPKEKRWGRYPNPTVHIGLGQLRRVMNALIDEYGRPHSVVIEMVRDLKRTKKQRDRISKEQAANQKKNKARDQDLRNLGERPNYQNRLRLRLWEELNPKNALDRRCPFSGEIICLSRLFSSDVEIEHLIPRSVSLDNSPANKTVCFRAANRLKGQSTPYEAFGETPEWEGIKQRSLKLPRNKRWRFAEDALEQFDRRGGFLDRQLNETGWLARLSKEYLAAVVSPNNIWVTPGRLTSDVRHHWGLNSLLPDHDGSDTKRRTDHRHHAIDAFVVALTDPGLLQRMSRAYKGTQSKIKIPPPWDGYRNELESFLENLVVSYKPDHGTHGVAGKTTDQLHNATAYGIIKHLDDGKSKVVLRKTLDKLRERDLKPMKGSKPQKGVQGLTIRAALLDLWTKIKDEEGAKDQTKIAARLAQRAATEGVLFNGKCQKVRRVRVVDEERVIVVKHGSEKQHSKGYLPDNNEFADVWEMGDGSWKMVVVPKFEANQLNFDIENYRPVTSKGKHDPNARRLMRLQIDDMGALGKEPKPRIVRVRKITNAASGAFVVLDDHNEANVAARVGKDMKENRYEAPRLKKSTFRKVRVDEIGRVWNLGPLEK